MDGEAKTPLRFAVCVNTVRGVNRPCCGGQGSLALLSQVEKGVAERGLNVSIEKIVCLNKCFDGPNMRIIGGEIFNRVSEGDVPEILDRLESLAGFRISRSDDDDPLSAVAGVGGNGKVIFPGS